ncbi:MAG: nucleotidyltransferase domain-containing protein [Flavobacteriales bacterium]|nr:nucleotidyltransferase domain-containing protein [Flavobacteriales bacterium]MBK9194125.1 nucleotidyltransferase domain-containing protein [Flavobacteriales bacterium]
MLQDLDTATVYTPLPTVARSREVVLSPTARAVVRTLLYFDIFKHPLRKEELKAFSHLRTDERADLNAALNQLLQAGLVVEADSHFALSEAGERTARRARHAQRAKERMAKALHNSTLIGSFPFVRAVMLSGSISKGVLDEEGDIDYFIITAPRRLWVARTLLVLYKKLFLLNSRRDFCVNYFIDTEHLAIEDRNLFTATEVVTLVPTYGAQLCRDFFRANHWAFDRFPNMPMERPMPQEPEASRWKSRSERMLRSGVGEWFDDAFMRLTYMRWRRKFGGLDERTFELALRTRKYVSKHHPQGFQQRVLDALSERIAHFEAQHGLSLA